MKNRDEISATMAVCLAYVHDNGGEIVRHVGGFWMRRNATFASRGMPNDDYFGTTTIKGLVARKRLEYSEWRDGRGGRFPIAARVVDEGDVAATHPIVPAGEAVPA